MKVCVALVAALALVVITPASAKAPPDGFRLCGATHCFVFGGNDAEVLAINMFSNRRQLDSGPTAKPFWTIRWHWNGEAESTAFYVPGAFRTSNKWFAVDDADAQRLLARAAIDIEPMPAAPPTRVTVGGKPVRDPTSYAALWTVGKTTYDWHDGWIRVRLYTDGPSPWRGSVAVSKRGGLLLRDETVFRISPRLAARIRARVSLR